MAQKVIVEQPNKDCRQKTEGLSAFIAAENPFFYAYKRNPTTQTETARLSQFVGLTITQTCCQRHHIVFELNLSQPIQDLSELAKEVFLLFNKLYFNSNEYDGFRDEFENKFIEYFSQNGIGKSFNFPINDRTFICEIQNSAKESMLKIEMVKWIFNQKIQSTSIPSHEDDGWYISD